MNQVLEKAEKSSDVNEKIKAIKTFIKFQLMEIKVQGTKKDDRGSFWKNFSKLNQEAAKKTTS